MRTYCCANSDDYDFRVDQPCNAGASSRAPSALLSLVLAAGVHRLLA